jgi:hypothetical protein
MILAIIELIINIVFNLPFALHFFGSCFFFFLAGGEGEQAERSAGNEEMLYVYKKRI